MDIRDIDDAITQYRALERAVWHAAKTHLPKVGKDSCHLQSFYVEGDKIVAEVRYHGSYSGSKDVELLPYEIAFPEKLVKIEQPNPEDYMTDQALNKLVEEIIGRTDKGNMSVDDTDQFLELALELGDNPFAAYTRHMFTTAHRYPHPAAARWHQMIKRYTEILTG